MMGRALAVAAAVLALTAAVPAAALAGTASISGAQMNVAASALQENELTVSVVGSNFLVVETGASATLTAGAGCASGGLNSVLCPRAGITSMSVTGADSNDALTNLTSTPAGLDGGSGNDVLTGGPVGDTLTGGTGSDYANYAARTGPVVADLDGIADDGAVGENDRIMTDVETLIGGSAADTLTGNGFNNGLDGGPGADQLNGGAGNDYVLYWTRTNPVRVSFDGVANDGESGENDALGADVESAAGGAGNDTLVGNSAANQLVGMDGNDSLDGQGGSDDLYGFDGVDTVLYSSRTAAVSVDLDGVADDGELGEGDDVGPDIENVSGGAGADTLLGDAEANVLAGGAGNDTLAGGDGDDTVDGGAGADLLTGGGGVDLATYAARTAAVSVDLDGIADDGQAGERDNVGADFEKVSGGSGADRLVGDADASVLAGGAGNDTLDGGGGADLLSGGSGVDLATYAARTAAVSVDLDGVTDDGQVGEGDNVGADVERVSGGSGADRLVGDADANVLAGGAGNDTLAGGGGNDALDGGTGDDTLDGGGGADALGGGSGADLATYAARTAGLQVDLDGVADDGEAGEGDNVAADVENVSGGSAGDRLVGDGDANVLIGGAGDDTLDGRDGRDGLIGAAGSDSLRSRDGTADHVSCGGERDDVTADTRDEIADDCEAVSGSASATRISKKPVQMGANGVLPVRLSCPAVRKSSCRGTITLVALPSKRTAQASRRSRRGPLGKTKFKIRRGQQASVKMRASRHGRRRVLRQRSVRCKATVVMRDGAGRTTTSSQTIKVKASRRARRRR